MVVTTESEHVRTTRSVEDERSRSLAVTTARRTPDIRDDGRRVGGWVDVREAESWVRSAIPLGGRLALRVARIARAIAWLDQREALPVEARAGLDVGFRGILRLGVRDLST
jgi:hypothetical protein